MSGLRKTLRAEGVIPAIITPFDKREELDEASLRLLIRRQLDAGVHGLFCLGTNGEFYTLSADEKVRIVEIAVEEAAGRIPVYAGAGSTSLRETRELAKRFEAAGADGLSLLAPYFMSYTQQELIDYYMRAADATRLPITLYNIPARTGNALLPATVAKLAEAEAIIGIKDSGGSFDTALHYLEAAPRGFAVLSGNDGLILSILAAGGQGTVSAMANICPDTVVSIYNCWKAGDYEAAERQQRVLRVARQALRLGTQPAALKAFVERLGLPAGPARRPVAPLSAENLLRLGEIVERYLAARNAAQ